MNCSDVSKGLVAYLERRADSAERHALEAHLTGCAECRVLAEQFRALWGVLDEMPVIEPTFAFDGRVRQRVAAEPVRRWFGWLVPQPRLALSAAMLAVMAVWMVKTTPLNHGQGRAAKVAAGVQERGLQEGQQEDFNAIQNLDVLENYEVVTSIDALSQLAPSNVPEANDSRPN